MRTIAWAVPALLALLTAPGRAQDSAWIPIFNGKDLNDWAIKIRGQDLGVNLYETFKVVDGFLTVDYSKYPNFTGEPFGHMAYKVRPFSFYLLRAEYRFDGNQVTGGPGWANQNNGFMLHSQSMASMGKNQDFPISIEVQLLGPKNGGSTMNICTPGTHFHDMQGNLNTNHCVNATNITKPVAPAWTAVSVLALGDSVWKHMVGRDTVFRFTKPVTGGGNVSGHTVPIVNNGPLKEGYITIQAESAPVQFRKIEVLDLVGCMDKTKAAYRPYFVRNNAAACNVTGVGGKGAAPDYRILRRDGSYSVEGSGPLTATVMSPDGTVIEELRGEGPLRLASGHSGLRVVRISGPAGSRTLKLALP